MRKRWIEYGVILGFLIAIERNASAGGTTPHNTPPEGAAVLGSVHISSDSASTQARRYVFVRGHRVQGLQPIWYHKGKLYLGESQIHPAPPTSSPPPARRPHSARLDDKLKSVPYVVRRKAAGQTTQEAVSGYLHDTDVMLKTLAEEYLRALPRGRQQAEAHVWQFIDTAIVVTKGSPVDLPRFEVCGGFSVMLRGFMRYTVACPDPDITSQVLPQSANDLTKDEATSRAQILKGYFQSPGPTVILIGASGNIYLTGTPQAKQAADEIEWLQKHGDSPEMQRNSVLPQAIRQEILSAMRGANR